MKRVIVTGGAGFLGSYVVDALLAAGCEVLSFDCLLPQVHPDSPQWPAYQPVRDGLTLYFGDVRDPRAVPHVLQEFRPDTVVHLAAMVGVGQSQHDAARYTSANVTGTANLLHCLLEYNAGVRLRADQLHGLLGQVATPAKGQTAEEAQALYEARVAPAVAQLREQPDSPVEQVFVAGSMSSYGEGPYRCDDPPSAIALGALGDTHAMDGAEVHALDPRWQPAPGEWDPPGMTPAPAAEWWPMNPASVYAWTKQQQEVLALLLWRTRGEREGLEVKVGRFFNCYDSKTEILTADGFKLFCNLLPEDRIATLNPDTKVLEYHEAEAWQVNEFSGELLRFSSESYDLCVTPEHRMYVKPTRVRDFEIMTAQQVADSDTAYQYRLMCGGAQWAGEDTPVYVLPEYRDALGRVWGDEREIDMGDWCEFLGWWIAEGSAFVCGKNMEHRVGISQYKHANPDKYERIVALVRRMGFNPYLDQRGQNISVTSCQLYVELRKLFPLSGAANKCIPAQIRGLAPQYLARLYEAMMLGDGSGGLAYTTNSTRLVDDFTEVCVKLGRSVTWHREADTGVYRLSVTQARMPQMGDNRKRRPYLQRVPYDGLVYDVTVPNHIIYVRRNGKSCWSGNCYGPNQSLTNPYTGAAAIFSARVKAGLDPVIFEDGGQLRDFTHASDVASAVLAILERGVPGESYNVCTGVPTSILQVALAICAGTDAVPEVTGVRRVGDIRHCYGDAGKLRALGWEPSIALPEGLAALREWVGAQPDELTAELLDRANADLLRYGLVQAPTEVVD